VLGESAILGGLVATILVGCWHGDTTRKLDVSACEGSDSPGSYRTKGKALVGDVNADGTGDRVTLRVKEGRPARCRHLLVVQITGGVTAVEPLPSLAWPGTDPQLLLLAQVDGRPGLEPVVAMSSAAAVYRPGAVFTLRHG
jgi:hypothetical protein